MKIKNEIPMVKSKAANGETSGAIRRAGPWLEKTSKVFLAVTVGAVVCVLLFIFWIEPNRPVARVTHRDGTVSKLTTRKFQQRLEIERTRRLNLQKAAAIKAGHNPSRRFKPDYRPVATFGFAAGVIDRLTRENIIKEEADRRRLIVTDDEVDLVIARTYDLVVWPKETPAPANSSAAAWLEAKPELREEVRKTRLETQGRLERDGLPAEYREIVRVELLEEKLRDAFLNDIPLEEDRVMLKLIRLETEADARAVAAAMSQGETFDALYARVGEGTVSGASGIVRDWSSRTELERDYNAPFSQAVMDLSEGDALSQTLGALQGWYFVKVDRREIRKMPVDWRHQRGLDAMQTWLAQQNARIVQDSGWMRRVTRTPHITYREDAGELPPFVDGLGPTGKLNNSGLPTAGSKGSSGTNALLGRTDRDRSAGGTDNAPSGPSRTPALPTSHFPSIESPIGPGER